MPVYLCKPGVFASEPWRHGIPVYAEPFALALGSTGVSEEYPISTFTNQQQQQQQQQPNSETSSATGIGLSNSNSNSNHQDNQHIQQQQQRHQNNQPEANAIRRIRHAEVVLVDDVIFAHENYWLRLRWPGTKGGFAGYVCLVTAHNTITTTSISGSMSSHDDNNNNTKVQPSGIMDDAADPAGGDEAPSIAPQDFIPKNTNTDASNSNTNTQPGVTHIAGGHNEDSRAPSPGLYAANSDDQTMRCLRTGIAFPSSPALQLLTDYDDGLVPPVTIPSEGQNVFCRICRDGLHEDDEDQQQQEANAENPLLAPCECSGSMAFVHYLCVEQWRCRSRHPEARNGTHCETCSKPYALPPPSSRPVSQVEEEWLEAMPPHVMAALRQPHIGWQIGAALVRRRWLRPMAPIVISPLVALYCRARRMLKKRGVSRRRWACSLCRRRARWKCVRCLRSYYCSRQCQNVSWHIVHKHVCYKPSRFWWSVVAYGALILTILPGIWKDPLLYDLALSFIPPSFYIMAVLGGGLATALKKMAGVDLRGRVLEFVIVLLTAWLLYVSWGIVWGFFGSPDSCVGVLSYPTYNYDYNDDDVLPTTTATNSRLLNGMYRFLLKPAKTYFLFWDRLANTIPRVHALVCSIDNNNNNNNDACFPHLSNASPELMLTSAACAADLQLVATLWMAAGFTLAVSAIWKKRRRGGGARQHQD